MLAAARIFCKTFRTAGWGRRLLLAAVAALLALTALAPDVVWAQDAGGDRGAWFCWRTGDGGGGPGSSDDGEVWGDYGFGYGRGWAVEGRDVVYDFQDEDTWIYGPGALDAGDRIPGRPGYGFYDLLADYVDINFFVPITAGPGRISGDGSLDILENDQRRLLMYQILVEGADDSVLDGKMPGLKRDHAPWGDGSDLSDFLQQRDVRAVDARDDLAVTSFYATWEDLDSEAGGLRTDQARVIGQLQAGDQDFAFLTDEAITGGREVASVTQEEVLLVTTVHQQSTCSGTTCTVSGNASSQQQRVDTTGSSVETNDGEKQLTFRAAAGGQERYGPDGNVLSVQAVGAPVYEVPQADERGAAGFAEFEYADTDSDLLVIDLGLNLLYRQDFLWDSGVRGDLLVKSFGETPWTWPGYGANLRMAKPELTRFSGADTSAPADYEIGNITGYRAPHYSMEGGTNNKLAHVRWPVNFSDVNWYLYDVTGQRGEQDWLQLLDGKAVERLVKGAYAETSVPVQHPGDCSYRDGIVGRDVECATPFDDSHFIFPFDIGSSYVATPPGSVPMLGFDQLVRAGVARPLDVDQVEDQRSLTQFQIVVAEQSPLPRDFLEEGSYNRQRLGIPGIRERLTSFSVEGVPSASAGQWPYVSGSIDYLGNWPNEDLIPDRGHLLVVTFYESYRGRDLSAAGSRVSLKTESGNKWLHYPKRSLRKVLCRMYIPPIGITSPEQEALFSAGWWQEKGEDLVGWTSSWLPRLVMVISRTAIDVLQGVVKVSARVSCQGLTHLDNFTRLEVSGEPAPSGALVSGGRLQLDHINRSRNQGLLRCRALSQPEQRSCDFDGTAVYRNQCRSLPQVNPFIERVDFIEVPRGERLTYKEFSLGGQSSGVGDFSYLNAAGSEVNVNDQVYSVNPTVGLELLRQHPDDPIGPHQRGLARVQIGWNLAWGDGRPLPAAEVDGYIVEVEPDLKVDPSGVASVYRYVLPRAFFHKGDNEDDDDDVQGVEEVDSFSFGALGFRHSPRGNPNVYLLSPLTPGVTQFGDDLWSTTIGERLLTYSFTPLVVTSDGMAHYEAFVGMMRSLPVMPGFRHKIRIYSFDYDPIAGMSVSKDGRTLLVDGNTAACLGVNPGNEELIRALYSCDGASGLGSRRDPGVVGTASLGEHGLLSLLEMDICRDLFTTTPAGFTWDNPAVKQVWSLLFVVSGGVLFALLSWQGFRMTYDWWIDPQPSTGFRELLPRFLLAFGLSSVSLIICSLVLILASDLTCFVAQHTGVTMWGMWGNTMGGVFEGYLDFTTDIVAEMDRDTGLDSSDGILAVLRGLLLAFGMFLVIILFIIALLYLFIKVAIAMLLRLALLALLCAVSPLAFAMYASEQTAHWLRTWVSMFLGATFQQVVVLVVIYLGGRLLGDTFASAVDTGFADLVVGMVLAVLILALADKVPDLVNPSGRGLFSSAGRAVQLGVAGTVFGGVGLASLGAGVATGAAGGAAFGMRNLVSGIRGRFGGGSSGDGAAGSSGGGDTDGGGGGDAGTTSGGGAPGSSGGGSGRGGQSAGVGGSGWGTASGSYANYRGFSAGLSTGSRGFFGGPSDRPTAGQRAAAAAYTNPITGAAAGAVSGLYHGLRHGRGWMGRGLGGFTRGQRVNNQLADIAAGNFLYRHRGGHDDTASQLDRFMRRQGEQPAAAQQYSQGFEEAVIKLASQQADSSSQQGAGAQPAVSPAASAPSGGSAVPGSSALPIASTTPAAAQASVPAAAAPAVSPLLGPTGQPLGAPAPAGSPLLGPNGQPLPAAQPTAPIQLPPASAGGPALPLVP